MSDPNPSPDPNVPPPAPWPGTFAPPPPGAPEPTSDEKLLAVLAYVLSLVAGVVAPLVIWLVKRQESSYVDHHGRESLNFQITVLVAAVVVGVLMCIPFAGLLAIPLALAVSVGNLVLCILGTIRANEGVRWRYPVSIRFVR
jgi:hypothetical protein